MNAVEQLTLTSAQLQDVQHQLTRRIEEGLQAEGKEIRALPSYFCAPDRGLEGSALVIDTGGTNMRAAVVSVRGGQGIVTHGPLKRTLPVREGYSLTAEEFFMAQATLAAELNAPAGLPVGYCFSYPSQNTKARDSLLLRWTKGIDIPGVVGTMVGSRLELALIASGYRPGPVRVLNDTVASMLGGASIHTEVPSERTIGLIVGTGNNMAAFFGADRSKKVEPTFRGKMAINLESGNFSPPHLTVWDDEVDAASDNPGFQRFEKAVSGFYLPFVFQRLVPDLPSFDPLAGTGQLVAMRGAGTEVAHIAEALLTRSADLVAASLAGVIALYEPSPEPVGILAEGTFFWGDPGYAPRVESTLSRLLPDGYRAVVLSTDEANLIGSAAAALEP